MKGDLVMTLTKNKIYDIIFTGKAEHSSIAEQFILEAKKQYGVDIAACYLDTMQSMNVEDKSVWKYIGFGKREKIKKAARFTNHFQLELYYRNSELSEDNFKDRYGDDLLRLLKNILAENGCNIEYRRTVSTEEYNYYGFHGKKYEEWDKSKFICSDAPVPCEDLIYVRSFDEHALSEIPAYAAPVLNRSIIVKSIGAKVYVGMDGERKHWTLYVVLPENRSIGELTKKMLKREMLLCLHHFDKFGVVKDSDFHPIFVAESDLSDDQKFMLAKDTP